jgi:hypothetical protein
MTDSAKQIWRSVFLIAATALLVFAFIEALALDLHEATRLFLLAAVCLGCRWHAGHVKC